MVRVPGAVLENGMTAALQFVTQRSRIKNRPNTRSEFRFTTSPATSWPTGVGMAMRKMGSMAKPDVYIIKDGDTITVKTESTFKSSHFSFKLGEKFEENTLDGRKTQTLITLKDDGSLIQEQEWDGKKTIITRKLVDGQLVVECDMNGIKCTRVYQKA